MTTRTRTTILTLVIMLVAALPALAQTTSKYCKDTSDDEMACATVAGMVETPVTPIVHRIGEGVVNAPGSELAYVILANYDSVPVIVTARFLVSGFGITHRVIEVPAHARISIALQDDQEDAAFMPGLLRTFSVRIYVPTDNLDVSLVLRPAADPFGRAIIPPVTVK